MDKKYGTYTEWGFTQPIKKCEIISFAEKMDGTRNHHVK
jgi:hypothetical protein